MLMKTLNMVQGEKSCICLQDQRTKRSRTSNSGMLLLKEHATVEEYHPVPALLHVL
jgi:hypothetical protein